jgi:high-affinity K+ transport system ATPase subunit B
MVERVVARNVLAEVGRALFALPDMVTTVVRNGRTEVQARVQLELTPQGAVRVQALVAEPLASQLEQQASEVLAQVLARMQS